MTFGRRTTDDLVPDRYKKKYRVEISYTYKQNPTIHFHEEEMLAAGPSGAITEVIRKLNTKHNFDIDPFRASAFDTSHDTKKKLKVIDNPDYAG